MDISRLRKKNIRVWLPITEGVEVFCGHLTQSEWEEAKEQSTAIVFNRSNNSKTENFDIKKFRALLVKKIVFDIRGLTDGEDEHGNPLPFECTPENLEYLMHEWTEFRTAVMDTPLSLEKMLAEEKEVERKNSEGGSKLDETTPK